MFYRKQEHTSARDRRQQFSAVEKPANGGAATRKTAAVNSQSTKKHSETIARIDLNADFHPVGRTEVDSSDEDLAAANNSIVDQNKMFIQRQKATFYISGGNGSHLVEDYLTSQGWERITERHREDYKLRWCEMKNNNTIHSFREGEQLLYQIPNNGLLTTKIGLLTSLQEYDRVMWKVKKGHRILRYQDFFPESYRLDLRDGRNNFFNVYKDGELWISKPTGANQGKGIYLIRSQDDVQKIKDRHKELEEDEKKKNSFKSPMARLVQRYVTNPLLLEGRKFDVRNYMIIACTNPLIVLYRDGYCRLTCTEYEADSTDLTGHLTNQFMQKKSPKYEQVKEDTVWTMDRFNQYINENFHNNPKYQIPIDWVHTVLRKRCQQVMLHCFNSARHRLDCKLGYFDLIGCDFLVHDDFSISILEMNTNPALHTNCQALRQCIPDVVSETLGLVLECFEKASKRVRIEPLRTAHNCILLYNADIYEVAERREKLQQMTEMQQKIKSAQRKKNFNATQYIYRRNQNPPSPTESTMEQRKPSMTKPSMTSPSQKKLPFYAGGTHEEDGRPFSSVHRHSVTNKYQHVAARVNTRSSPQQQQRFDTRSSQQRFDSRSSPQQQQRFDTRSSPQRFDTRSSQQQKTPTQQTLDVTKDSIDDVSANRGTHEEDGRPFSSVHRHSVTNKYQHVAARVNTRSSPQQQQRFDTRSSQQRVDTRSSQQRFDTRSSQQRVNTRSSPQRFDSRSSPQRFDSRSSPQRFDSRSSPQRFDSRSSQQQKTPTQQNDDVTKDSIDDVIANRGEQQQHSAKAIVNRHQQAAVKVGVPPTTYKIELNHRLRNHQKSKRSQQSSIEYRRRQSYANDPHRNLMTSSLSPSSKLFDLTSSPSSSMLNVTSPMLMLNGSGDVIMRKTTSSKIPYSHQTSSMYDVTIQRHRIKNCDDVSKNKRRSEVIDDAAA